MSHRVIGKGRIAIIRGQIGINKDLIEINRGQIEVNLNLIIKDKIGIQIIDKI